MWDAKGLKLSARVFNLDGTQKFSRDTALDAAADSTAKVFVLPQIDGLSPAYFLIFVSPMARQAGRVELLLALDETGNPRLGKSTGI